MVKLNTSLTKLKSIRPIQHPWYWQGKSIKKSFLLLWLNKRKKSEKKGKFQNIWL